MMPELTVETILLKWKNYWMERCRNAETKLRLLELEAKLGDTTEVQRLRLLAGRAQEVARRFREDETTGYRSRDRQYALDMLTGPLADLAKVPGEPTVKVGEWRVGDTVELKPSPLPQRFAVGKVGDTITTTLNGPKIGNPPKGATVTMTPAQREARFTVPESPHWLTSDTEAKVNRGRPAYAVCRCGHWEIDHQETAQGGRCQVCPNCTYQFYEFRRSLLGKDVGTQVCGTCHQQFKTSVELRPSRRDAFLAQPWMED